MTAATREALTHLEGRISERFGAKEWTEFANRLTAHGEELFRPLHRLYGWRYDFAWIYERIVETAATGYLDRRKALRRIDRSGSGPSVELNDPSTLWATAFLDGYFSDPTQLEQSLTHLTRIGVTHLHLIGSAAELARIGRELMAAGITFVVDFPLSHTSSDHPWARAAANGAQPFRRFYFEHPDRQIPDQYAPHLRSVAVDREGDAFSWHPNMDGGRWVWSTHHPSQWDLDYSEPEVLATVAGEIVSLANLGAGMIKLDGLPLIWKQPGTNCEALPETHLILRVLRVVVELVAPSVSLVRGDTDVSIRPTEYIAPDESRLGFNSLLMSSAWEALASGDTRLLARALEGMSQLSEGCAWLNHLGAADAIGWEFSDLKARSIGIDPDAHRKYLNSFYQGSWPGSWSRGDVHFSWAGPRISGTVASLAGLEVAVEEANTAAIDVAVKRILATWALIVGAGGIPTIFLGDEIAQFSDHAYKTVLRHDNRSSHRPPFDFERLKSAELGEGPEGLVLAGLLRILEVRRGLAGFEPTVSPDPVDLDENGVIAFRRGPVIVVVNLTANPVLISRARLPSGELFDHIRSEEWDGPVLAPYEYRYLTTG